jgi:hypothetical protein
MDGWIDGQTEEWMDGQKTDGQADGRTDSRTSWTDKRTDEQTDRLTDRQTDDGWQDGQTDGQMDGGTDRQWTDKKRIDGLTDRWMCRSPETYHGNVLVQLYEFIHDRTEMYWYN